MSLSSLYKTIRVADPQVELSCEIVSLSRDFYILSAYDEAFDFSGVGVSECPELALKKAWYELNERRIYAKARTSDSSILTSSGFSAHDSTIGAVQGAVAELIERHSFLSVWYSKGSLQKLSRAEIRSLSPHALEVMESVHQLLPGAEIGAGIIGKCHGYYTSVAYLHGLKSPDPFGVVFSSAASLDPGQALYKAVEDQVIVAVESCSGVSSSEPTEFNNSADSIVFEHKRFFMNPRNAESYLWFIDSKCRSQQNTIPNLRVSKSVLYSDRLGGLDVKVARAKVLEGLELKFGRAPREIRDSFKVCTLNEIHPII